MNKILHTATEHIKRQRERYSAVVGLVGAVEATEVFGGDIFDKLSIGFGTAGLAWPMASLTRKGSFMTKPIGKSVEIGASLGDLIGYGVGSALEDQNTLLVNFEGIIAGGVIGAAAGIGIKKSSIYKNKVLSIIRNEYTDDLVARGFKRAKEIDVNTLNAMIKKGGATHKELFPYMDDAKDMVGDFPS
jgi:hypothetical protein